MKYSSAPAGACHQPAVSRLDGEGSSFAAAAPEAIGRAPFGPSDTLELRTNWRRAQIRPKCSEPEVARNV